MKPLMIDGFCGLGGASEGFLAEGWRCVGIDIERHDYGQGGYPGDLILQDMLTVHGSQFKDAHFLWFSPPCQFFSYTAMPWSRSKRLADEVLSNPARLEQELALFKACFQIQREASDAAGRYIPMVVENVVGAQRWVGPAKWHYGSFYLWGDVPALMPMRVAKKNTGGSWFATTDHPQSTKRNCPDGRPLRPIHTDLERKYQASCAPRMWKDRDVPRLNDLGLKTVGHVNMRDGHTHARHLTNQRESDGLKLKDQDGYDRNHETAFGWKAPRTSSKSNSRKAASAMIARIPLALSRHIAQVYKPC